MKLLDVDVVAELLIVSNDRWELQPSDEGPEDVQRPQQVRCTHDYHPTGPQHPVLLAQEGVRPSCVLDDVLMKDHVECAVVERQHPVGLYLVKVPGPESAKPFLIGIGD